MLEIALVIPASKESKIEKAIQQYMQNSFAASWTTYLI